MDVLSDVLSAVRLTGAVFFDINASAPFVGESPSTPEIAPDAPTVGTGDAGWMRMCVPAAAKPQTR